MTEFDTRKYEREQFLAQQEIADKLRNLPAFQASLNEWGRGSAVTLECPRHHRLLRIVVEDLDDRLVVRPVSDHAVRESGATTYYAEPWRQLLTVCRQSGCPATVDYDGWCVAHGAKRLETIGDIRTGFKCRQCKKRIGDVTTVRLLKLYGTALALGLEAISIGDTPKA